LLRVFSLVGGRIKGVRNFWGKLGILRAGRWVSRESQKRHKTELLTHTAGVWAKYFTCGASELGCEGDCHGLNREETPSPGFAKGYAEASTPPPTKTFEGRKAMVRG